MAEQTACGRLAVEEGGDMKEVCLGFAVQGWGDTGKHPEGWWDINKGGLGNVDVEGESECQHPSTRRTMRMQA